MFLNYLDFKKIHTNKVFQLAMNEEFTEEKKRNGNRYPGFNNEISKKYIKNLPNAKETKDSKKEGLTCTQAPIIQD